MVGEINHEIALTIILFKIKRVKACMHIVLLYMSPTSTWKKMVGYSWQKANAKLAAASTHQKWWRST